MHDGLGSTVALTDGSGNVTATYEYDAFGALRSQTGPASTPWQFTGQQLDAESSLYFLRARYYDPTTGRFLGKDPLSSSLNPYSYAHNNPVNATDPSGMVATTGSDADLGYPVISDVGGSTASKEGGQMPSYADCQNQTNPLWLFCPSALIRLANGAIIDLPPWERSLLDGLAGLDSGGDAAYATGNEEGRGQPAYRIAGTQGLFHSFSEHAKQWFGRDVTAKDLPAWQALIERAARSTKVLDWSVRGKQTVGHLARIEGKYFLVQFYKDGEKAGELATAFVPGESQLTAILRKLGN